MAGSLLHLGRYRNIRCTARARTEPLSQFSTRPGRDVRNAESDKGTGAAAGALDPVGASYSFIKIGVKTIPPVALIAARILSAGMILVAIIR